MSRSQIGAQNLVRGTHAFAFRDPDHIDFKVFRKTIAAAPASP
jgi:hypothetical protein